MGINLRKETVMKKIPVWVLIIGGLFVLAPLAFSIMGYMNPSAQFASLSGAALSLAGPLGLYLSRNIATGLVMAVALFKREPGMLLSAFLLRLFTDILDIVNTVAGGGGFPVPFLVFVVMTAPCVWALWPLTKTRE
jgi:hypothetical protein